MHRLIKFRNSKYFYLLILIFISSLNNYNFQFFKDNLFKIRTINISGINNDINHEVKIKLDTFKSENLLFLKKNKIENVMRKFNYIDNFSIFKKYPSELIIKFELTNLIGKTYRNNKKYFIGSNLKLIDSSKFEDKKHLPVMFGNFNTLELTNFLNSLKLNNFNIDEIKEFYYFESKRWDIILKNNLLIKFPNTDVDNSIQIAKKIIDNKNEIKKVIDLRVSNQVIIRND